MKGQESFGRYPLFSSISTLLRKEINALKDYKDYKDFKDYSLHSIHQPVKTAVVHRLIAKLDYHPTINSS